MISSPDQIPPAPDPDSFTVSTTFFGSIHLLLCAWHHRWILSHNAVFAKKCA